MTIPVRPLPPLQWIATTVLRSCVSQLAHWSTIVQSCSTGEPATTPTERAGVVVLDAVVRVAPAEALERVFRVLALCAQIQPAVKKLCAPLHPVVPHVLRVEVALDVIDVVPPDRLPGAARPRHGDDAL